MKELTQCYLHLGSNLGDRFSYIKKAKQLIEQEAGELNQCSSLYETEAWGQIDQADFINQAIGLKTSLKPTQLLQTILSIEEKLGRERKEKWAARTIDIDILFFGEEIIKLTNLTIPHPYLHQRNFVLIPMLEIAGDWIHPELSQSIEELYLLSKDPLEVIMLEQHYE